MFRDPESKKKLLNSIESVERTIEKVSILD